MTQKTLVEMSDAELEQEISSARDEYVVADYIEQFHAWRTARESASARMQAAVTERARRRVGETNGG